MRLAIRAFGLAVLPLALGTLTALGQDVAVTGEGPRFLLASADRSAPVEAEVSRVPMLRRQITLALRDVSLPDALKALQDVTDIEFVYSPGVLSTRKRVTLRAEHMTVAAILTDILVDAHVDVLLSVGKYVTLVPRRSGRVPPGTLLGKVTDAKTGRGLVGVDVYLHDTKWHGTTDTAGRYRIPDVDAGAYTMVARRLGYTKSTRQVTVRAEQEDTVDIVMTPTAIKLDELVTTATGQQRRRDIGNAITTINADSVMRSAPIRNLTDLLDNRVPGLSVQHVSGAPGDPARLRLRGISSVMRGNDPVVVVDGVRVYSTQSDARSGNLTNLEPYYGGNVPAPSPLDQIDPNTIEKVEVFKGPSAATLYGADAANGVIVITTKRGKPGPTRWDARAELGRTTPAGPYPTGYYRWGHLPETGQVIFCPLISLQCEPDSLVKYQALNDPDATILGQGQRSLMTLTASGGSQALTYSVTGTYGDERGLLKLPQFAIDQFRTNFNREPPEWMRRPWALKTWSVTNNVNARLGATADVTLSATLSRSEQQRTELESQQSAMARAYVDKRSGTYYLVTRVGGPFDPGFWFVPNNPLTSYFDRTTASTIKFTTGLSANWRPRSWFTATGRTGVDVIPRADERLLPTGLTSNSGGRLIRGTGRSLVSTFDLQGNVRRPLKWGFVFETNVGTNLVTQSTNDVATAATGLVPGTSSLGGAQSFHATDAQMSTSVFGWYLEPRITGQRLSLSTGLRLDGGSTYGARLTRTGGGLIGGLLGLPKLNGSWVISEEPWFPFNGLFSSLRLRGAYGQAQVQPGATDRLRLYTRHVTDGSDLLEVDQLGNADLRPERSTEFEGGFDADLLNSRLSLELTAYRKVQIDALMPVSLPGSVHGGGSVVRNIGNIRNTGLAVTARLTPVQTPLVTWSAELNLSHNTNTLTKLGPGVEADPRHGIVAGYPVGGRWALPILGFADHNGDGVISAGEVQVGDSLVFMGRLLPAYESSMFTNLAFFRGAVGVTAGFSYDAGATQVDQTAKENWVLNRALVDPSTPLIQQAAAVVLDSTDYGLTQDVSTFRFVSLAVTYRAPRSVARLLRAQQLSVALQGANLGLHSSYRGKDPDVTAWSPTERIVDTGQIALPRTWQLMLSLQY